MRYARCRDSLDIVPISATEFSAADTGAVAALQELITPDDPSVFVHSSEEEFLAAAERGFLFGYTFMGIPISVCSVLTHGDANFDWLGENDMLLDSYFVAPRFRGNLLGASMVQDACTRAEMRGAHNLFATVSPKNPVSAATLLRRGFLITSVRLLYGYKLRYIMKNPFDKRKPFRSLRRVEFSDTYRITRLLADGYTGFRVFEQAGILYLWLGI